MKFVTAGANPIGIQRGIQKAVEAVVEHLAKISKKVKDKEEIKQVAIVSSNWDTTIGEIIADGQIGRMIRSLGGSSTAWLLPLASKLSVPRRLNSVRSIVS